MAWAHKLLYVRYITGLAGNQTLLTKVAKQRKRAEKEFRKDEKPIQRFYKPDYKAKSENMNRGCNITLLLTAKYKRFCTLQKQRHCALLSK